MNQQRGGCCIARCAGGAYDKIMLRFRPIAPKPAGSIPVPENRGVKSGRRKRKAPVKTLPLLPEEPGVTLETPKKRRSYPLWLSFEDEGTVTPAPVRVECVTDTWESCYDCGGIGSTDEERVMNLHLDTCPSFVSDGLNRIRWTNAAYRRMVEAEAEEASLVVRQEVALPVGCTAFTCRVRLVTCGGKGNGGKTMIPCDVWRMDCGGFAWRLDTTAALSLRVGL